jgi:hypothetical protein
MLIANGGSVQATEASAAPWWRRREAIIAGIVLLVVMLLAGSFVTSRGGLFSLHSAAGTLQTKAGDPNRLAEKGEKLLLVVNPPSVTRKEIRLTKNLGKPVFLVEFQPYGLAENRTAVIRVGKASAQGGTKLAQGFAQMLQGQNLQVLLDSRTATALTEGGSFSGEIRLIDRNGMDSFGLSAVKATN